MKTAWPQSVLNHARSYVRRLVEYQWSAREYLALAPFFSNVGNKVFFIERMPEGIVTSLLAMYSRLKNPRGIRGNWVDSFLPSLLAAQLPQCEGMTGSQVTAWMKERGIVGLDSFCDSSNEANQLFELFVDCTLRGGRLMHRLALSDRMRQFLQTWLDAYGHNSIARTAKLILCHENGSILVIKIIELTRLGSGAIEISTRYTVAGITGQYPIWEQIALFDSALGQMVYDTIVAHMNAYGGLMGEKFTGVLPTFLRARWKDQVSPEDLATGVTGETCDVLGNLLPCTTLTSVGVALSGEAFSQVVKHLYLEDTPESIALAEFIREEADRVGAGHFLRHCEPTEWERATWIYLSPRPLNAFRASETDSFVDQIIARFNLVPSDLSHARQLQLDGIVERLLQIPRGEYDKLPSQFEVGITQLESVMSFRGWRDNQRQTLCTHLRGRVTPLLGFYSYPKPAPPELGQAFAQAHSRDEDIWMAMAALRIPESLREYVMAMGELIPYQMASNIRQGEFCVWQRSDYSVNDEVRQEFLKVYRGLCQAYPWLKPLLRVDDVPRYIFARGKTPVPMPSE